MKNIIQNAVKNIPEENRIFIRKQGEIADHIECLLEQKGWSQKDLAQAMRKTEAEISRMLNTPQNLTLKTRARIEAALGEEVIIVPKRPQHLNFVWQTRSIQQEERIMLGKFDFSKSLGVTQKQFGVTRKESSFLQEMYMNQ